MIPVSDWTRCKPWIEAALLCTGGTHGIDDIEAGISAGHFQFWPGQRCAAITEIEIYPQLKALNFFLLGGDLTELRRMAPSIEVWGRIKGCTRFTGSGRPAWGRALRTLGYAPKMTFFVKELG